MKKDIIILTKSIKRHGYCVAGIDVSTGGWIRIISDDASTEHAVSNLHMRYADGTLVKIYDVVQVDFIEPKSTIIQPENWLFNNQVRWVKVGESNIDDLLKRHPFEDPNYIFYNTNNAITDLDIDQCNHSSLLFVKIPQAEIFIKTFENKKYRLNFTYGDENYQYISITDEVIQNMFKDRGDGCYPCGLNLPVVFSLTDRYHDGRYYKIAAQFLSGI